MMKRFLTALTLILALSVPASALTDAEYIRLKRSPAFAQADREHTRVYNQAKDSMSRSDFEELRESQREWIDYGRDEEARRLMREDYSRIEAYTEVTRRRAAYIRREISEHPARTPRQTPSRPRPNSREADQFTGYFSNDNDVYMAVQWVNRNKRFMGVRLRYRDEEWFGRGYLHGRELTVESGSSSITLHFVNDETIRVITNESFQRRMEFDAEGRYNRYYGK